MALDIDQLLAEIEALNRPVFALEPKPMPEALPAALQASPNALKLVYCTEQFRLNGPLARTRSSPALHRGPHWDKTQQFYTFSIARLIELLYERFELHTEALHSPRGIVGAIQEVLADWDKERGTQAYEHSGLLYFPTVTYHSLVMHLKRLCC